MTNTGGGTCVWQWKVSEEGENQGSPSKVDSTYGVREEGWRCGPATGDTAEPQLWGEGTPTEDPAEMAGGPPAGTRRPQVGEPEGKGQGRGRELTSRQAPAARGR